jgi:hypothetical protein
MASNDIIKALGGIIGPVSISSDFAARPLTRGDRVRIREGYEGAGDIGYYVCKSVEKADEVRLDFGDGTLDGDGADPFYILAAAIEPYPYTREERIERAIEDYLGWIDPAGVASYPNAHRAALYAILDAGV